jgi:hypothetical protein
MKGKPKPTMNLEAVAALCQRISSVGIAPTALIVTHTKQRGGQFFVVGRHQS